MSTNNNISSGYMVWSHNPFTGEYEQVRIPDITTMRDPSTLNGMTRIQANYGDDMTKASQIGQQVANSGNMTWQTGLNYGLKGLEALAGLMNAFTGYKSYKLAKDQFGFTKAAFNRNLANQAKIINNTYDNAAQVAAGMIGGTDSYGNYGMVNQDIVDRYAAEAEKKHVDGSKI
jgi:methyl-accepting chemotaxis protein